MLRSFCFLWVALVAPTTIHAAENSRNHVSAVVAGHRGFFEALYKDFEKYPKDKAGFVGRCSKVVDDLLPILREEYTEKQVGSALFSSCEQFNVKVDFRHSKHSESLSEPVLTRAKTQCRYFAKTLDRQYQKDKDYKAWCGNVFKYLVELTIDPSEVAKRFHERDLVRSELQKVQAQWQAYRKEKSAGWSKRRKFKRDLSPWAEGFDAEGSDEGGSDSSDGSSEVSTVEAEEDQNDAGDELDVRNKDWLQCCPEDCKVCGGYTLVKGVVRAAIAMRSNTTVSSTKFLAHKAEEQAEDSASNQEDDEDEEQDEGEESSEDEDEEEDEEGDEQDTSLIATSSHTGQEPLTVPGGFYSIILKEFSQLPKTKPFMDRCTKVITNLMPVLEEEYTWKQVPNNLLHNCDVYSTKTDFKVPRMELKSAHKNCQFFAKRLGKEFQGKKDYKGWCADVYAQLLRESNADKMTDKQKEVLKNREDVSGKVYGAGGDCCPANCRVCK